MHEIVNPAGIEVGVAVGPRRLLVDLSDDHSRLGDRRLLIVVGKRIAILTAIIRRTGLHEYHIRSNEAVVDVGNQLREMTGNSTQGARAEQFAQITDGTIASEGERISMFWLERVGIGKATEKDVSRADAMALFDQPLDESLRFAGTLSPYDVVAGPYNTGEIETA